MARPNVPQTLLKLVGVIVACAVLAAGVLLPYVGGMGLVAGREANKFLNTKCNLIETPPPQKTYLYAKDGTTQLASLYQFDRDLVSLKDVPKYLQQALIATEDRRFYSHHGVDMRGLLRSALSSSGGDTQGGSTLTMQYVKQVRYYQADTDAQRQAAVTQTLTRKMEDAQCALDIEKKDGKAQILEKYLNIAFFGENSYGIGTAARNFFGKPVSQLTLPQAALLVGVVKAPTEFDPFVPAHRQAAIDRRNQVIQNLADVHDITQAQANQYKQAGLSLYTTSRGTVQQGCAAAGTGADSKVAIKNAGFFCDYVEQYLKHSGLTEKQITTSGLRIVTTLDPSLQNSVQASLWTQVLPKSKTTAVMPMVDPHTGNVLAMATSKQYGLKNDGGHTTLPIFTSATAGGGSTYKLFPLLAALKVGVPHDLKLSANENMTYTVQHCGGTPPYVAKNDTEGTGFTRTEQLDTAMQKSSNTYFVSLEDNLFQGCTLDPYVDTALGLGLNALKGQDPGTRKKITVAQSVKDQHQATFVLGYAATSPLELTGAYATVANDGVYCAPSPIVSIKSATGQDVPVKRAPCAAQMSTQVARQAQQVLASTTRPPGTSAAQFAGLYGANPGISVAGKTGTVNATDAHGNPLTTNADLWFAGVTPDLAATTALFNIDNPNKPITGIPNMTNSAASTLTGDFAAQVWAQALTPQLQGKQWAWPDPNDVANATPIPSVVGQPYDQAKATLIQLGFKTHRTPFDCGSSQTFGSVAYQGANTVAPAGATIELCVSDGQGPGYVYVPPKPTVHPKPTGHSTPPRHGGGGGGGTTPGGGRRSGGPPSH